jgi:hypothetical protein
MIVHRCAATLAVTALLVAGTAAAAAADPPPAAAGPATTTPLTPQGQQGQQGQHSSTGVIDPVQALLRPLTCALPPLPPPVPGGGLEVVFDHSFTGQLASRNVTMEAIAPAYTRPSATFDLVSPLDPADGTDINLCYTGVTIPGGLALSAGGGTPSLTFTGLTVSLDPSGLYVRPSTGGQPGEPFQLATFSPADVTANGQVTLGPFPSVGVRYIKLYLTPAGAQQLNAVFGTGFQAGDLVGAANVNLELLPLGGDYTPR